MWELRTDWGNVAFKRGAERCPRRATRVPIASEWLCPQRRGLQGWRMESPAGHCSVVKGTSTGTRGPEAICVSGDRGCRLLLEET